MHSEQIPHDDEPADGDDGADDRERRPQRTRGAGEQKNQCEAHYDRNRHVDQECHEAPAKRTHLHPRRQACLAIRSTRNGRFHDKLLVV